MKESVIRVEHFTKKFGTTLAVDDISFQIMPGTLVGFVGKNGAGKSTTLRTFMNMIKPTSGRIQILGMDVVKDARKIKASTCYMPSESIFYERLKVREVLSFCLKFSLSSMQEVDELQSTINQYRKEGRYEEAAALASDNRAALAKRKSLTSAQRQFRALRNDMELVRRSKVLSADEKRERINNMLARRNNLASKMIQRFETQ